MNRVMRRRKLNLVVAYVPSLDEIPIGEGGLAHHLESTFKFSAMSAGLPAGLLFIGPYPFNTLFKSHT